MDKTWIDDEARHTKVYLQGLKSYVPTRLQMEMLAHKKVEAEKAALEQRIAEMEEQRQDERMPQERSNVEIISNHGSNSRHHVSPRSQELSDEGDDVECEENGDHCEQNGDCAGNQSYDYEEDENAAAQSMPPMDNTTTRRNVVAPRFAHDELVGKDVILYALVRSDVPVKGHQTIMCQPCAKFSIFYAS